MVSKKKQSMKENRTLEEKVENTLASLDQVERATPRPFLYTRIMAKMSNHNKVLDTTGQKLRYKLIVSAATLLFVANILVVSLSSTGSGDVANETDEFVDEYGFEHQDIYEIE